MMGLEGQAFQVGYFMAVDAVECALGNLEKLQVIKLFYGEGATFWS